MLVNFMGINKPAQKKHAATQLSFQAAHPALQYKKTLTQDTVSFKGFPGDSRERDLLDGLKSRNKLRLDQLAKEGFHYQSPYLREAIEILEAWRADTEHSNPDLSWRLGELRAIQQYKLSPQFIDDARRVAEMVYL